LSSISPTTFTFVKLLHGIWSVLSIGVQSMGV
jgi:hypothetical protein